MLNNLNNVSLLAAARTLMPWWMVRINDFDGLEIHPCRVVGYAPNGKEIVAPCKPQRASFWAVYGHYRIPHINGCFDAFDDFQTEREAWRFRDRLLGCFPHLRGYRYATRH